VATKNRGNTPDTHPNGAGRSMNIRDFYQNGDSGSGGSSSTDGNRRNDSTPDSDGYVHRSNFTISPTHRAVGVSPEQAIATTHRADEDN